MIDKKRNREYKGTASLSKLKVYLANFISYLLKLLVRYRRHIDPKRHAYAVKYYPDLGCIKIIEALRTIVFIGGDILLPWW